MKGQQPASKTTLNSLASPPRSFWTNPWLIISGTICLFLGAQLVTALLITPLLPWLGSNTYRLASYATLNLLVVVAVLSLVCRLSGYNWRSLGWRWPGLKSLWVIGPAFILYIVISLGVSAVAQQFIPGFEADQAQDIGFAGLQQPLELITAFVSLVVITPLLEEILFRGLLLRGLRAHWPFWLSAVVTSGLFALAHGQWNVAVDTFALSLILCFLVERSHSIIPAVLLHSLKNGLAFVLLFVIS